MMGSWVFEDLQLSKIFKDLSLMEVKLISTSQHQIIKQVYVNLEDFEHDSLFCSA